MKSSTATASGVRGRGPKPMPLDAPAASANRLRNVLVATDALALMGAWTATIVLTPPADADLPRLLATIPVTLVTLRLVSAFHLYRARVCAVRAVEVSRLAHVSVLSGGLMLLATSWLTPAEGTGAVVLGSFSAFATLTLFRCVYASWLRAGRIQGRYIRRLVVVGDNEDGLDLQELVRFHPELGFDVAAVARVPQQVRPLLEAHDANGVIVAAGALGRRELNVLVRELLDQDVHVVMSSGLLGIDHARIRSQPFAREPLYYVEPTRVSRTQLAIKRTIDILGGCLLLLLTFPVLVVSGVAIKLQDRGPILFRHQRIGRNGTPFTVYKLRSMVPGAEKRQGKLQVLNQRKDGPIFKVDNDPRVTRVGRVLRATSIDELPQLFNVLQGTMSLVGPRPALPSEVADFDEELLERHRVRPGITGLWQVEARDNPSFHAYRRLDLFYIENLSVKLDLLILLDTFTAVLTSAIRALLVRRAMTADAAPAGPEIPVLMVATDLPGPGFASVEGA